MISRSAKDVDLKMFCVLYVDMKGSTHTVTGLKPDEYAFYYTTFYDILSEIASKFGGRVIKHVGDALIICFPATADFANRDAFKSMLDCAMAMLEARCSINDVYREENLPSLSYRISADYGRMESIETSTSPTPDWIGPPMNLVAKMNHLATENIIVVGGDLHQALSRFAFEDFRFETIGEVDSGIKQRYPIYSVTAKNGVASERRISSLNIQLPKSVSKEFTTSYPNIAIVDDEKDILLVFKQYLSGQPINVEVFADPVQLLGRLGEVGPSYYDLVILDVRMPKMDGFQVHQILTALKPNIKTLFVSALDYAGEVLTGLRGIDKEEDFIKKPVSRENFIFAVNKKINLYA